jgi:hypothetical protein
MFQHDISHTGQSSVDTSGTTGAFKWQVSVPSTNGSIDSSPVIGADGAIYISYCPANTDGCLSTGQLEGTYTQHGCNQGDDGSLFLAPCQ